MPYQPNKIEKKWQAIWDKAGIYKTPEKAKRKKNFYHLVMFPYPSGDLHIGHWYNFGPADIYARFKRMSGFNVMSPIGFDGFGLPAENAAIKRNIHPKDWTFQNIKRMRGQLKSMGNIYDWQREVITCEPDYYKWTQWMFLQLYKAGLAYRAKTPANWCPGCKTILANEQAVEGKCERCSAEVRQKEVEQWLFKITDYAEPLLKNMEKLDWPERTKTMQKNWIGRSVGAELKFKMKNEKCKTTNQNEKFINVFTTRADTIFGATYLVVAPEHKIISDYELQILNIKEVKEYIEKSKKKTELERQTEAKEKTGVKLEGIMAINPANGKEIPIFVADYVLTNYGTGAIMAVPAHDQRDFDFAKKYNLPCSKVIQPPELARRITNPIDRAIGVQEVFGLESECYEGEGELINSGQFNGQNSVEAREKIGLWLAEKGLAKKQVNYKLRDWIISRQRYWGAPIPMINCEKCGWVPVPEKDLPVLLPNIKDFKPSGEGQSPLSKSPKFVQIKCPKCKGNAQRETDTMDTFVCSSWYFLRYADPKNKNTFASPKKLQNWLPVNMYIGGAEHTVLHLLYARFFTKVLKKLGFLNFSEPFSCLRHQGIILGPDGQKMSKSKGNVIDPDSYVQKYGADAVRTYLCFMGPYAQGGAWQMKGIVGVYRFLQRVWDMAMKNEKRKVKNDNLKCKINDKGEWLNKLLHKTIKKVTEDIENFRFNTAISSLMILVNEMQAKGGASQEQIKTLLLLLAPFAPHITEELWNKNITQSSIHNEKWPRYNPKIIVDETISLVIQINGKAREIIQAAPDISEKSAQGLALSSEKVRKWLEGRKIIKTIFVPGKLINIVIS